MVLVTGGAVGADELARQWACSRKVDHIVRYAKWEIDGKAAGPIRNLKMLGMIKANRKKARVIAFRVNIPGENRGTDHMCRIAEAEGIKVKRVF
jgi:hypothetical protein